MLEIQVYDGDGEYPTPLKMVDAIKYIHDCIPQVRGLDLIKARGSFNTMDGARYRHIANRLQEGILKDNDALFNNIQATNVAAGNAYFSSSNDAAHVLMQWAQAAYKDPK